MKGKRPNMGLIGKKLLVLLGASVASCIFAVPAHAAFELTEFGISTSNHGAFARQAGAHPDMRVMVNFSEDESGNIEGGGARDLKVGLPAGMVGNATNVPTCTMTELIGPHGCPAASQVGVAKILETPPGPNAVVASSRSTT